ncbi:hypothetical protein LCGC14_0971100 [marine sediment metagenome]|uniref:Uncharacterized protein n=1 Tax=marine sediment metagenome TaxID=412755 RepID=A0A0F9NBN3_9ZZZZ
MGYGEYERPHGKELNRVTSRNGDVVVLVHFKESGGGEGSVKGPTEDEWVTWMVDPQGNRFWGHYFFNEEEARTDFWDRVGRL